MERVIVTALWVKVRELRERSGRGVAVELREGLNIREVCPRGHGPAVEERVRQEACRVGVVDP